MDAWQHALGAAECDDLREHDAGQHFGGGPLASAGGQDIFVAKFDSDDLGGGTLTSAGDSDAFLAAFAP